MAEKVTHKKPVPGAAITKLGADGSNRSGAHTGSKPGRRVGPPASKPVGGRKVGPAPKTPVAPPKTPVAPPKPPVPPPGMTTGTMTKTGVPAPSPRPPTAFLGGATLKSAAPAPASAKRWSAKPSKPRS